jgi:hypothetical protein
MNPIGVTSMGYARPSTAAHPPLFGRMKAAGTDCRDLGHRRQQRRSRSSTSHRRRTLMKTAGSPADRCDEPTPDAAQSFASTC